MLPLLYIAGDSEGQPIWIADAHRGDGERFIVRADDKLTAFLELERAICVNLLTEEISETGNGNISKLGRVVHDLRFDSNGS